MIIAAIREGIMVMADCVAWDLEVVRQRALVLLSVADSVKREGWDDAVAVQLRQAAHDLLGIATDEAEPVAAEEAAQLAGLW